MTVLVEDHESQSVATRPFGVLGRLRIELLTWQPSRPRGLIAAS